MDRLRPAAEVITFAPRVRQAPQEGPPVFSEAERAEAAAWAAERTARDHAEARRRGHIPSGVWAVLSLVQDDDGVSLTVEGPGEPRAPDHAPACPSSVAFHLEKTATGVVVLDGETLDATGPFPGLRTALEAGAAAVGI